MSCVTESELQSALPKKCLPVPGEKLNIVLICFVSLMVPLLRSSERTIYGVRSSVSNFIVHPIHSVVEDTYNVLFYYHVRPDT